MTVIHPYFLGFGVWQISLGVRYSSLFPCDIELSTQHQVGKCVSEWLYDSSSSENDCEIFTTYTNSESKWFLFFKTPVDKRESSTCQNVFLLIYLLIFLEHFFLLSEKECLVSYLFHFSTNCSQILHSTSPDIV